MEGGSRERRQLGVFWLGATGGRSRSAVELKAVNQKPQEVTEDSVEQDSGLGEVRHIVWRRRLAVVVGVRTSKVGVAFSSSVLMSAARRPQMSRVPDKSDAISRHHVERLP